MSRLKKIAGASNKLNKQSFKQYVLNNGHITIDEDGRDDFVVIQINNENFKDISPAFKRQLEDEGKYNSWIGFITFEKQPPYTVQMLPIYGNSQKYVTKWFTNTADEAIDQCLSDKQMQLLKRANDYIGSNDLL